ncbi:transcriptional regulator domain-containing protein [Nitrobacter winogradskyi]|uniref:transcriptional regulator domain-containing protein n=1 Tax=Nitrobacter winogradskyi TaxID=913 RepID=UPI00345F412D
MANAAYLYILFLDRPAIAWEHLRRNPDYCNDWLRFRARRRSSSSAHAQTWGLRFLREPRLRCPRGAAVLAA